MEVGWREWRGIVEADDVERCERVLKGETGPLYHAYSALLFLVKTNPPRILAYLKEEMGKVVDVRVRWYAFLVLACEVMNKDLLEEILGEVDYEGNELAEPLYYVCLMGRVDLAQLLLSKGASENGYQEESNERVYQMDHILDLSSEVVEVLVRDPSKRVIGCTPLGRASYYGYVEIVKVLLSHGADVNLVDLDGRSALHRASRAGYVEVVKVLLSHGADMNLVGRCGTPLSIAARWNHRDVVDLLISEGASIIPSCGRDHTAFILDEKI